VSTPLVSIEGGVLAVNIPFNCFLFLSLGCLQDMFLVFVIFCFFWNYVAESGSQDFYLLQNLSAQLEREILQSGNVLKVFSWSQ